MINHVDKMSSKTVKVSANGRRVFVDPKKKIVTHCNAQVVGPTDKSLSSRPPMNKLGKRKRANEFENKCSSCSRRTFLKNYSNFMKSGLPQHLLFSQDGQWVDFSQEVINLVKEGFQSKRAAIEVKCNRCHFMLDILYMVQIDLKTGVHKPIAWIDEAGICIFPDLYSSCHCSHEDLDLDEQSNTPEINLPLETEVNELNNNKVEEDLCEANVKRVKVDQDLQKDIQALPIEEKRGGMLSKHTNQKGILPQKMIKHAAQQGGCENITSVQDVDSLEQKSRQVFCTFCRHDVPFRIAATCSVCQGYCHELCAVGTNIQTAARFELLFTCKRCYAKKDVTHEKEVGYSSSQGQENQHSTTPIKARKQNGNERPLKSNPKSRKKKLCLGLIWKKKKSNDTGTEFRENNLLLKGNPNGHLLAPKCHLCAQPYKSELMYIQCQKCNHWFHAESVELQESQVMELFGFKCCKCRRIRIPICPYTDPKIRLNLAIKKIAVAKAQRKRFRESDFYPDFDFDFDFDFNSDTNDELVKED